MSFDQAVAIGLGILFLVITGTPGWSRETGSRRAPIAGSGSFSSRWPSWHSWVHSASVGAS